MKNFFKRTVPFLLSGIITANCLLMGNILGFAADSRYELESGTVTGTVKDDANASDGSYVFFENTGEMATITVPVETEGMYDIIVGYSAPYGNKTEYLMVDDQNAGSFSCSKTDDGEWTEVIAGTMRLTAGNHNIGVQCSWSWVNVDYIRISPSVLPEVTASDKTCADPQAIPEAQKLMEYLSSVYGKNVLSGQQEYYGVSREDEFDFIQNTTGELPVIRGFDFGDTCPLYAWDDGVSNRIIDWVQNKGGIATASWHINVPVSMNEYNLGETMDFSKTTYSEKTDFSPNNVLIEGTKEHDYFLLAVENLATELKKLNDANVPLLFRPFHEAEGNGGADGSGAWFWWAKDGADTYVELYRYLYDLLTEEYDLHNLIWEFNSYTYNDDSKLFYPGDDFVDIIGYDKYNANGQPNESAISSTFYNLIKMYDNKKMIALMENDTIPSVENMTAEGAYWLYFMPWYGEHLMDSTKNNPETLKTIYQSDLVITLDEFKEAYAAFQASGTTQSRETTKATSRTAKPTTTSVTAPPKDDAVMAQITASKGNYIIEFNQAIGDEVNLIFNTENNVSYANGCMGISVNVDGTDYWVSYQWEISKSGEGVETVINMSEPFEVTYNAGTDKVTDTAKIAAICEEAKTKTGGELQVWWVSNGEGEALDTTDVILTGAYLKKSASTDNTNDTTTPNVTTTTSVTTTNKDVVMADIGTINGNYEVSFGVAMGDEVNLIFDTEDNVSYANGCLGISVNYDGTDYWISYKWEISSSGNSVETKVDLSEPFEVSYDDGAEDVTDEALITILCDAAKEMTNGEVQIWWVNDNAGDALETTSIVLTGAYLMGNSSIETTTTTAKSTTTTTTTTQQTTTTTKLVTTDDSTSSETNTTSNIISNIFYGDVNRDGRVDITDAVMLNKALSDQVILSDEAALNADCNNDGSISTDDSSALLRFLIGLINTLPSES